jgi:hypothetical protein
MLCLLRRFKRCGKLSSALMRDNDKNRLVMELVFVREFQQEQFGSSKERRNCLCSCVLNSHCLANILYHNFMTSWLRNDGVAELVYPRVDALVFKNCLRCQGTVASPRYNVEMRTSGCWSGEVAGDAPGDTGDAGSTSDPG